VKILLVVAALLAAVAIVFVILKKRASFGSGDAPWPYYVRKPLTPPEQVLYHRLVATMPDHIVLAQVQLSRVLGVKKGFNFHEWNNRVSQMSLDFLVCLKDSTVVAAIELDDKTHQKETRKVADEKKERALSAAGIALIRWQVSAMPNEATIRQALAK
jgi:very-short-patch-repair endonuclease